jgi:Putative zinc- or iron-chelating domain
MTRTCGSGKDWCGTCCKLLPMKPGRDQLLIAAAVDAGIISVEQAAAPVADFAKPAGQRCPHQRHNKGCSIYDRRPFGCRMWSCRWLLNDDTAELSRPDRAHYVIDVTPDFVTGDGDPIPVIQVWVDPDYPNAHEDPALRDYLERRGKEGYGALIRYDASEAFFLVPPSLSDDGRWHEIKGQTNPQEHTIEDKIQALGTVRMVLSK